MRGRSASALRKETLRRSDGFSRGLCAEKIPGLKPAIPSRILPPGLSPAPHAEAGGSHRMTTAEATARAIANAKAKSIAKTKSKAKTNSKTRARRPRYDDANLTAAVAGADAGGR